MNKKSTMIIDLSEPAKIGTANLANPNIQEIAGTCPYCGNQIRIPTRPVIDAETKIAELEQKLYHVGETLKKYKTYYSEIEQKLSEIKELLNAE